MTLSIFVPGIGQHENIGDVILRRQLLDRLRGHGTLHVFTGASTESYDTALGLRNEDVLYHSFSKWYAAALRGVVAGRSTYVFKPGEIQLTLLGMKEHISMLPVVLTARLRGKPVIRVGVGSRNFAKIPRMLMRPSVALSSLTYWRDTSTAGYFSGRTMPDLAFAEGTPVSAVAARSGRDTLVVSMRSDRTPTPQTWIDGVIKYASQHELRIVAISQVVRDNSKTEELAARLGGESWTWDGTDHWGRETSLRQLFDRAQIVVSDRLHVLIAAFTEGAVPAALLCDGSDKIQRHFAAAGIDGIDFSVTASSAGDEIASWLNTIESRRSTLLDQLSAARAELDQVFDAVDRQFGPSTSTPDSIAYHVGRKGEVAGGMTQVMNSYLSWQFPDFTIKFIRSRGSSSPIRGVQTFAVAVARVLTLPNPRASVLVVHLSQGGSFIREGTLLCLGRLRGLGVVAQLHGSSFARFADRRTNLVGMVLRRAHGIHTLSDETARKASELAPSVEVIQIPNAVAEGRARTKEPLVVFGGSVNHRKGVDVLLEAWAQGFGESGWTLAIAGPVAEPSVVPEELPPNVQMLGGVEHTELMDLLERSRIAVLPSRDEAMPMFLIEAMARANAVVSTRVGGIPGLVSETAGKLTDPGDSRALGEALRELMQDEDTLAAKQRGAYEVFAASFSEQVIAPKLSAFWARVRDRNSVA